MTTTRRGFLQGASAFALLPSIRTEAALVLHGGVVLGRHPLREPPESLVTIPIERTMAGGRWVHEA